MYRLTQAFFNVPKMSSSLFSHNAGQIKIEVIPTEFNSIDNIGVEQLHKKFVNDKI